MSHQCPAPICSRTVPTEQFACRGHWYALPAELRRRIWAGYRTGSDDHQDAMADAIGYLADKYPAPAN